MFGLKWQALLGRTVVAPCFFNFNSGKTRMAPKTSKFTTAWWLASKWQNMPLAMKCQINNQKSKIFPNTNLDRLGKTGRYLQLFCTAQTPLRTNFRPWQLVPVPKLPFLAFAVEIWAHLLAGTAWKNNIGTLLLQLQQWQPCKWQN